MIELTDNQYEMLVDEIYSSLMAITRTDENGNVLEMDMGDMGDCHDEAQRIVDEWATKANITFI